MIEKRRLRFGVRWLFAAIAVVALFLGGLRELYYRYISVPLANAVASFNASSAEDAVGKLEPPLTEDEIVASIQSQLSTLKASDQIKAICTQIARTRRLPRGASLQTITAYAPAAGPPHVVWWIDLRIATNKSWYVLRVRQTDHPEAASRPPANEELATMIAQRAHTEAAVLETLLRFSYQARYRQGTVDALRGIDISLDRLMEGLTAPMLDKDWLAWHELGLSWDEQWLLWESAPGENGVQSRIVFGTATDAWLRREASGSSSVEFLHADEPAMLWKRFALTEYGYLRLTPHRFWWGPTVHTGQTMCCVPPEQATWRCIGSEDFGGEVCNILQSPLRAERLWIGRDSGRVRGVASYHLAGFAVSNAEPHELIQFDDYRETAPEIWLPFRELRATVRPSETASGQQDIVRSELQVKEIRTDRDLSQRCLELMPKDGAQVQEVVD